MESGAPFPEAPPVPHPPYPRLTSRFLTHNLTMNKKKITKVCLAKLQPKPSCKHHNSPSCLHLDSGSILCFLEESNHLALACYYLSSNQIHISKYVTPNSAPHPQLFPHYLNTNSITCFILSRLKVFCSRRLPQCYPRSLPSRPLRPNLTQILFQQHQTSSRRQCTTA